MCAMCDRQSIEDYANVIEDLIRRHGWALQYVNSDSELEVRSSDEGEIVPAYCYTVGLTGHGHPEIVMTGRSPGESAAVLNVLARRVLVGSEAPVAGSEQAAAGFELSFVDVTHCADWLTMAYRIYPGAGVQAVQAVWRDVEGHLPWEGDFPSTIVQPVLGPPPGWYEHYL